MHAYQNDANFIHQVNFKKVFFLQFIELKLFGNNSKDCSPSSLAVTLVFLF